MVVFIGLVLANVSLAKAEDYKPPTFTMTEVSEMYWLALGIFFEARNQPVKGQMRVAEVILNRRDDPRWPNTIEGVVRQGEQKLHRCQFSFMCDGKPEQIGESEKQAWALAYDLARYYVIKEQREGYKPSCIHSYHADYATNISYFAKLEQEEKVGSHIFFCDK